MKPFRPVLLIALAAVTGGCDALRSERVPEGASVTVDPPTKADEWKSVATAADEDRIARLGLAWQQALAEARDSHARDVRAEGQLLEPRAGLPRPAPTPGSYHCRMVRLGKAEEIARGVAFLVDENAGFVTGSTLSINGGQHMY